MTPKPIIFRSTHRIRFTDLDPYGHMTAWRYTSYFMDHRFDGMREHVGWDLKTMEALRFMCWLRRIEIDFVRAVRGDQDITITSFVRAGGHRRL